MKNRTNRILAFSLAVLMLVGNLFHYSFYLFAINKVKCEMQHELFNSVASSDKTIELKLSSQTFVNSKINGEEICLDGNWYDIVSVKKLSSGTVCVKCLADNDESILHSWMKKVVNDNSDNSGTAGKNGKNSQLKSLNDFLPVDTKHELAAVSVSATLIPNSPLAAILSGHSSRLEQPPKA